MKNIVIRKEWIEILEKQSKEFRNNVMGAIYDYALRGTVPADLTPMEQLAFDFIKTEMDRLDESLDFDGAQEAAIKKKRAAERRAERAAMKSAQTGKPAAAPAGTLNGVSGNQQKASKFTAGRSLR